MSIFSSLSLAENDSGYSRLTENTIAFAYQAFAYTELFSQNDLLKHYFNLASEMPTTKQLTEAKDKMQQVQRYIADLKNRNRFLLIHRVESPRYNDFKSVLEISPSSGETDDLGVFKLKRYIINDYLGDFDIYLKFDSSKIFFNLDQSHYQTIKKEKNIYMKLYGKILQATFDRSTNMESVQDLLNENSRPLRKIRFEPVDIELFTLDGNKIPAKLMRRNE